MKEVSVMLRLDVRKLCAQCKVEKGYFTERVLFTYHHDQCDNNILITVHGHEFNVSYKGK